MLSRLLSTAASLPLLPALRQTAVAPSLRTTTLSTLAVLPTAASNFADGLAPSLTRTPIFPVPSHAAPVFKPANMPTSISQPASSASAAMTAGGLVDDAIVFRLLHTCLSRTSSWLLDGYPRTAAQARTLLGSPHTTPDLLLIVDVPDTLLTTRLLDRRHDPHTGITYNLTTNAPPSAIAHRLAKRADDNPTAVAQRLRTYREAIATIASEFSQRDAPVVHVNAGESGPDAVFEMLIDIVSRYGAKRVVLAGPPGCGKGTQGKLLSQFTGAQHVSTGDLLRQACQRENQNLEMTPSL